VTSTDESLTAEVSVGGASSANAGDTANMGVATSTAAMPSVVNLVEAEESAERPFFLAGGAKIDIGIFLG
jgi:hypothetical protein